MLVEDPRIGSAPVEHTHGVDAEHPWLGLRSFTETCQRYFFGRTEEVRDLYVRIRDHPLTVLYGRSGYGKTSLLRAGLVPKLRVERYRPVHVRLALDPDAPSLVSQVREHLARACVGPGEDPLALLESWRHLESLWEIYTHEGLRPAGLDESPPVLLLDQFEEVLRAGASRDTEHVPPGAPDRVHEVRELFRQLGDLVENRAPAAIQRRFRDDPTLASSYEMGPIPARVGLALREDYLAELEEWRNVVPSLTGNRFRLRMLDGPSALEAVVRPGRTGTHPLVRDDVGAQIVRFTAQTDLTTPLEEIEAVPPLLSLVCERLNEVRLGQTPPLGEITEDLVSSQSGDILQSFYDESFGRSVLSATHVPSDTARLGLRRFIEDALVTRHGHRNVAAREDVTYALGRAGVTDPDAAVDALIARRLLSSERRGGTQRVELTHDILAPLVVRSREERKSREAREGEEREAVARARRQRRLALALVGVSALLLLALAASVFALKQRREAVTALRRESLARERVVQDAQRLADLSILRKLSLAPTTLFPVDDESVAQAAQLIAAATEATSALPDYRAQLERLAHATRAAPDSEGATPHTGAEGTRVTEHVLSKLVPEAEAVLVPRTGALSVLTQRFTPATPEDPADAWRRTCAEVADETASPLYRGLELPPQWGLWPLGRDPASGLHEFAHLYSGSLPKRDAATGTLLQAEDAALVFVLVPPGTLQMGEPGWPDVVTLRPFFLSKYGCTQAQWERLTGGERPSAYAPERYPYLTQRNPVEQVSWEDCAGRPGWFLRYGFRLPSEAEWEYAGRAGTASRYGPEATVDALLRIGWFEDISGYYPHAVGLKPANPWGLHDMLGNLWEWCQDKNSPLEGRAGYVVPADGSASEDDRGDGKRVFRGGSFHRPARDSLRLDFDRLDVMRRANDIGARPVRDVVWD